MDSIKLSVNIVLPGRTMMTSQECDKNPEENYLYSLETITSHYYDKNEKKWVNKKKYKKVIVGRKCIPAYQSISMAEDAYNYMISPVYPEWFKGSANDWKRLSKTERLNIHLNRICQSLGGVSYTYTVFED